MLLLWHSQRIVRIVYLRKPRHQKFWYHLEYVDFPSGINIIPPLSLTLSLMNVINIIYYEQP
jgi:hypothetical protein